jgi:selenium metabolism protein YedF
LGGRISFVVQGSQYIYTASPWTPRICTLRNFCNIDVYLIDSQKVVLFYLFYGENRMETLNCKGLACPQPVVETKNFLLAHPRLEALTVLVDNRAAAQNVERFLGTRGFQAAVLEADSEFVIEAQKQGQESCQTVVDSLVDKPQKTLVMITQDTLGRGDDQLGRLLLLNFLRTLKEMGESLWRLVLVNSGVKLTVEGTEALPVLQDLASQGVSILVCGTCLTHFGLLEKKQVGETTNMLDIVTSLQVADKVIPL